MFEINLPEHLPNVIFYSWLLAGTLFLFVELAMPGFLGFVSCSFGCLAAAAASYYDISLLWQCWIAIAV